MASVLLAGRSGKRGALASREVMPYEKLKYLLPPIVMIVDVPLSFSVKADTVRALSEHVLVSRVASGGPVIQREHR